MPWTSSTKSSRSPSNRGRSRSRRGTPDEHNRGRLLAPLICHACMESWHAQMSAGQGVLGVEAQNFGGPVASAQKSTVGHTILSNRKKFLNFTVPVAALPFMTAVSRLFCLTLAPFPQCLFPHSAYKQCHCHNPLWQFSRCLVMLSHRPVAPPHADGARGLLVAFTAQSATLSQSPPIVPVVVLPRLTRGTRCTSHNRGRGAALVSCLTISVAMDTLDSHRCC